MTQVVLLLGSNQGSSRAIFAKALWRLKAFVRITKASSIYMSEPWGTSGRAFLNQAIVGETDIAPMVLLRSVKQIERQFARPRSYARYTARPLDIDIVAYGAVNWRNPRLEIPHPRMAQRKFALVPLQEVLQKKGLRKIYPQPNDFTLSAKDPSWVLKA